MNDRHKNRKAHNYIDLTNHIFGKLIVLKDTGRRKSRRPIWLCKCDCGKEVEVLGKYLTNGDTKSCGCFSKGNAHNRDALGEITKSFWTPIERQAKRRGIPFELTREDAWLLFIKQNCKCAITGVELKFSTNIRDDRGTQTTSLDRIDSLKGYTLDNVQWVHKKINIMKNVMSSEEFLNWCQLVVTNTLRQYV
jgi:hypothetical protein